MSLPRDVHPGRFYMITRRCTQRMYLLRPDEETNNAFIYCLALAAKRFHIDVLLPVAMSNHHHTVIFDREGTYPAFIEHFHKLLARCLNVHRSRWENFWASEQTCVVRLVHRSDVIAKLVYTATNPVKDHLVERAHQWPGVNGWRELQANRPLEAVRPHFFFRAHGDLPARVTLELVVPPELGHRDELVEELRVEIERVQANMASERHTTGRRIVGRREVRMQSPHRRPSTPAPRRTLRPRVAAKSQWVRIEALQRNREFQREYRNARRRWLAGETVPFPPGTYWLWRFAGVSIATH
ncbi:MAG: transposase [Kofleriaceae bacterium]